MPKSHLIQYLRDNNIISETEKIAVEVNKEELTDKSEESDRIKSFDEQNDDTTMENTAEDESKKRLKGCYSNSGKKRDSKDEDKFYARTAALFRKTVPTYSRRADNSAIGYEHLLP